MRVLKDFKVETLVQCPNCRSNIAYIENDIDCDVKLKDANTIECTDFIDCPICSYRKILNKQIFSIKE